MKTLLEKLLRHEHLNFEEARSFIFAIEEEKFTSEMISGMLMTIQMRGAQLTEMTGFRSALLELSNRIELDSEHAIDLCGTGGDGKNTFNISTTTAFVLASMGKKVIKHGNYGVSSLCGSSNVLEELGIKFTSDQGELQRQLDERNICFLHAPLFHPAMKKVAPIRRNLGVRTIFNNLGPLINPAQPKFQLTGTYSLELARMYQHILRTERTNYRVLYGMDGFDEISLTDDTRILGGQSDSVLNAFTLNSSPIKLAEIKGGRTVHDAAQILNSILSGHGSDAQNAVVAANTAVALQLYHPTASVLDLFNEARQFIQSGHAQLKASVPTTQYL
ncbi:MAG: anthranilate phosphoribosyltransferase [Crocinitomicaceae bacterium]|nr:anthranilate phosphoribosyltransferase [Crocinitomicaceae bacterium]